jgi:pilus assembly protein CpaE
MASSRQIPEIPGTEPLGIAVISPDDYRRSLAIRALDGFPQGRIREFISYPPDVDSVTRVLKESFDVVIIDLDTDPEYTINLVQNICSDGATNVIVYSESVDSGMMLRCLRAGAREFLHTPITPAAMAEALARAWARRTETSHQAVVEEEEEEVVDQITDSRLFVFLSAKGGSGVTTLACSYALALAEQSGKRTLLIDLNFPLGDAALNLGVKSLYSTVQAIENASKLDGNFLATLLVQHSSNLWVLCAPTEMTSINPTDDAIKTLLNVALQEFEYVVVDAGSRSDLATSQNFDPAVTIFLVTQVGIPELRNANRFIKRLPTEKGPTLEVVINRFDSGAQGIDEIHVTKALTRPVRWKIPNDYAAVRQMQNSATPITKEDTPIARAILQMTQAVCGAPAAPEKKKKKKSSSFFSFL